MGSTEPPTDLAQAGLADGHLTGAVQLAKAPAEEPHGLDVAKHPDKLLLVQLERCYWYAELFPLSQVPDQIQYSSGSAARMSASKHCQQKLIS